MSYYDLGKYSRTITTRSADCQTWFDRGLNWIFAYNHGEAVTCFRKALDADPDCAMAHWGIAYAMGPNYNMPWHLYDPKGRAKALANACDAMEEAIGLSENVTEVEKTLIMALRERYPQREPADDMMPWNRNYSEAMRDLHRHFPDDLEVRTVLVESIMNETPWKMWDLKTGEVAEEAGTEEACLLLESAFSDIPESWDHPGLLHLYVHLMEMSPVPERALRAGDRLRNLVPDAGHLIHMPTHIDVLCGQYHDVVVGNQKAIAADRKYLEREGGLNIYSMYRIHNYHFAIYGAMFSGNFGAAMQAAEELIDTTPEDLLRIPSPPMADFVEAYLAMKQHVLVRFGQWNEIIGQKVPDDPELYAATTAFMLYAKTVAYSASGMVTEAEESRNAFQDARSKVPEHRRVHNNRVTDLLEIASEMADGELEYRKENYETAFRHLRKSVELDDALPYDEPWGWMQPTRHALGALLMEQGYYQEAEQVYREDLGLVDTLSRACRHPGNLWSLHGLHECFLKRGEKAEARHVKLQLDIAAARADVPVHASCFCRQQMIS